ncbi:zinc finger CCHC domain-containing protein 4 [Elysia marginata]|uniref:Zinc finger CCHC domain-containing protein 4 n=1 Tax=Elysia marginata TaxID=1093978 RepID=A0AAV4HY84_9GAST|nr:zinc finger CCHC domain-containing protein 4 [Elysia marginata]
MAARQANIELVTPPANIIVPSCPHGPALLFEQYDHSSNSFRQFFACSAFRDKRKCSFHLWVGEKTKECLKSSKVFSHKEARIRFRSFKALPKTKRYVCCTCGLLLMPSEIQDHERQGHLVKGKITLRNLKKPSFLFTPLDNNKTYAQYLFSSKTVDFLLSSIEKLAYSHVLCVGAPRIHEEIQLRRKSGGTTLTSMLLDLDERYGQFYPPSLYAKYNMFNHHFFERVGRKQLIRFLTAAGGGALLITDPPFGGMVEALSQSFLKISKIWEKILLPSSSQNNEMSIPFMWIFPYFLENRIVENMPSLSMLDYKVDYDNHNLFNNNHKQKGSPVRIFTNIPPAKFYLPLEDGYWFCKPCQRFSSKENQHCADCGTCPSKDGTTYVHCDACLRCVKPSRIHCFKCGELDVDVEDDLGTSVDEEEGDIDKESDVDLEENRDDVESDLDEGSKTESEPR